MNVRRLAPAVIFVIVVWAGAFVIAWAVVEWRSDNASRTAEPTAQARRLTATEAAAIAQQNIYDARHEYPEYGSIAFRSDCNVTEFSESRRVWLVTCSSSARGSTFHFVFEVSDESGEATLLSPRR